jgi:hypothetical protein
MVGHQQISFGEVSLFFICQEHSIFHSYNFHECSLFLELRLSFDFCLDLCSDLVISLHQGVFFASGLCWFSLKEFLIKSLNGVGKEKKLCAKKWYKKELV